MRQAKSLVASACASVVLLGAAPAAPSENYDHGYSNDWAVIKWDARVKLGAKRIFREHGHPDPRPVGQHVRVNQTNENGPASTFGSWAARTFRLTPVRAGT